MKIKPNSLVIIYTIKDTMIQHILYIQDIKNKYLRQLYQRQY